MGYKLEQSDINFRLKKKLLHQQKLKVMSISIAGFNCKVPRFH